MRSPAPDARPPTPGRPRHVHFVGIGGIGMSGLARVLLADGEVVSGSDLRLSPITDALAAAGARIREGHRPENVHGADLVVVTSAARADNAEIREAERLGIPIIKRAALLGELMAERRGIAVAGTHGKTTTSAMIAHILRHAGLDPTILVGGELVNLGSNAARGRGEYLVAEADEFDGSFLRLTPQVAVVTNVEPDHLDFYGTYEALRDAFRAFLANVPSDGLAVVCGDDPGARAVAPAGALFYGFGADNALRALDVAPNGRGGSDFRVVSAVRGPRSGGGRARPHPGLLPDPRHSVSLAIPGRHNVLNALAALAVARFVGVAPETAAAALAGFHGTRRRFERVGEARGVTVVDDYGHHPTEIRVTLDAARQRFPGRRLVVGFQPHTYSRTKYLFDAFTRCFGAADALFVLDIYAAREADDPGIHARDLAAAVVAPPARYAGGLDEAAALLAGFLRPGDVLLTIGAGDIEKLGPAVLRHLEGQE